MCPFCTFSNLSVFIPSCNWEPGNNHRVGSETQWKHHETYMSQNTTYPLTFLSPDDSRGLFLKSPWTWVGSEWGRRGVQATVGTFQGLPGLLLLGYLLFLCYLNDRYVSVWCKMNPFNSTPSRKILCPKRWVQVQCQKDGDFGQPWTCTVGGSSCCTISSKACVEMQKPPELQP